MIKKMNNNILIVAGGTGGHIVPAVVFGKNLQAHSKNVKWLCGSRSLEKNIYNALNVDPFQVSIDGSPLGSKSILKDLKRCFSLVKSFFQTSKFIKNFKPDEIYLFGGYMSFAPLLIAKFKKIPVTLHEQNAIAGKVTKIAAKLGAKILTGWPVCKGIEKFEFFGIPVREPERIKRSEALKILNLNINENSKIIGVAGGSLVSEELSRLLIETSKLCGEFEFVFLSHEEKNEANRHFILPQWNVNPFFSICDVIVCRAGGSTLAEALKWEIPAVTIPWPEAADNHQEDNAREFVKLAKNSHMFSEKDTPEHLAALFANIVK